MNYTLENKIKDTFTAEAIQLDPNSYGKVKWTSPSNIALVKYWGKNEHQIPANPSISFTLSKCCTTTTLNWQYNSTLHFEVWTEGKRNTQFEPKISIFLKRILPFCGYLNQLSLKIETENNFPHGSGIASSASGLSALALCICSLERSFLELSESDFINKASFLARLGSGSAARSVFPEMAHWGKSHITFSSNETAAPFEGLHSMFKDFQDTILLVDSGEKKVSSTVGHDLMNGHPFAQARFDQANRHLEILDTALKTGDLASFIKITELEALTLHAMMQTSDPYFLLIKPNTIAIIEKIWKFRAEKNVNICFTLDAGANVHVLYPKAEASEVLSFIKTELVAFCENEAYICDEVGSGPKNLEL